jgi:hypothetical protein
MSGSMSFVERFPVIKGSWIDGNPVYHVRDEEFTRLLDADGNRLYVWSEDVVRWEVRTQCGVLLDWWTREEDNHGRYTTLRYDLAARIARPCRRCYEVEE